MKVESFINDTISPGSKDWINKYFHLVEEGVISFETENGKGWKCTSCDAHLTFIKHGVLFGYSREPLFYEASNVNQWTREDRLKYLLFESLIFIHLRKYQRFDADFFLQEIVAFYDCFVEEEGKPLIRLKFLEDNSLTNELDKLLNNRITVKSSFISTNKWLNYIQNSFVFLDVILYDHYLNVSKEISSQDLDKLKYNTLLAVIQSAHADEKVTPTETNIFYNFLHISNLPESRKNVLIDKIRNGVVKEEDYFKEYFDVILFCHYLLDISLFTIYVSGEIEAAEKDFILDFIAFLSIDEEEYSRADLTVQQFIVENEDLIPNVSSGNAYSKMVDSLSNRWMKIIGRNKDKFVTELAGSKDLLVLLAKATKTDLTEEEKKKIKEQFKDLLKSVPSLAVFMLPGGAILLPVLLKIVPALLPSAFRDNAIEE